MRLRNVLGAALAAGTLFTSACSGSSGTIPNAQSPLSTMLAVPAKAPANAIQNGCFTNGALAPWTEVKGTKQGSVSIQKGGYGTCKYAAFAGSKKAPAPDGFYGVSQTVKVTTAGKLSFWYEGASNDEIKYGDQEVDVVINKKIVDTCYKALTTTKTWKLGTCNISKYKGQTVQLQFGAYDNGYSKTYDYWVVSDISLQ